MCPREFQRLRRIRQLGFSDLVYPGATHSRFAHSIGVYHTARRLIDVIDRKQGQEPDRERARVALLAALLHDIGHGPFSHAFEQAAGMGKRHEEWGRDVVQGDTEVNRVLCEADGTLPDKIGRLLNEEDPKDIYAAVVSSQFDADRLDYVQRDRLMTGVGFAHFDQEWLFNCLEVGSVTIGPVKDDEDVVDARCLYLGPKGLQVAEEYLEARFRLYSMVYMHKTTRAAEQMLSALLSTVRQNVKTGKRGSAKRDAVSRYLALETPDLDSYLALDDAAIWPFMESLSKSATGPEQQLARLKSTDARERVERMKGVSDIVLELAATVVFLRENRYGEKAVEEVKSRKPLKATKERVEKALGLLEELKLNDQATLGCSENDF